MPMDENTNLELISFIWLDNMANATQENREMQYKLRSIVNQLKIFDNCQECENYLKNGFNIEEDKIILLTSGQFGRQIIDHIHHLKQIISIFIFCMDKTKYELWAKKYKKIRGVITEVDDLLKEIELDCKSDEHKFSEPIDIFSAKDDIIPLLLEIKSTVIDKRQFLNICWKYYKKNSIEIGNIQDFEHLYSSSKALNYFFKQTFLYRLVIKSLLIFNIDLLYLLRFFLQDIEQQLKTCPTISVPVYRGQFMTDKQIEFLLNSINKPSLRFNSYIIAKTNREQVIKILENSPNKNNLNSVLFHIETNQIGKQYEEFIVFPITTQFQIVSIDFQNDIYIIRIIVSNLNLSFDKKQINGIYLAYRLRDLGQLDKAEQIFHRLSTQYPIGNPKLYDGLARIAQDKGLYDISLQLYEKSLSKSSTKDHPYCFNNIGCIYDYLEQYDTALEFYTKALSLMKNDIDRSMCFNNIGITLANQLKYQDAHQSFLQSLTIRQQFLPENHPDLGICYTNLGVLSSSIGEVDLAFECYERALHIFLQNNLHIYIAIVYQNMANILYGKNQLKDALNYYQQAANIFRKTRCSNHPNLVCIEQNINQLIQMK